MKNRWLLLAILSIGFFMILIDTTVVNVSIPTILHDLNTNITVIEWIISGYALSFAALLITFGRLGDIFGRKNLFLLGIVTFTVSSFFAGEANDSTTLIIARLFQGIGGAMISPSTLSIISTNFKGRDRAIAFGVWGGVAGLAVAVGPILGGFLTTFYDWRWIFRINIPIGFIGLILGYLFVYEEGERHKTHFDISGLITSTLGSFFLVFALIEGQTYGWLKPKKIFELGSFKWTNNDLSIVVPILILSAVFLFVFVFIEMYKTKKQMFPAFDMNFIKLKTFRYGIIALAVISFGEFSSLFTLPIYLQNIKGFSALNSGLALLPMAIATFIAAPVSGKLVNRIGSKWVVSTGLFLEFIGIILTSRINIDTQYWELIAPLAIFGTGIGLAIAQNTQVVLSEIPHHYSGSASGVLNTIRQVGSALGIALIGAVLTAQISTNIPNQINDSNVIPNNLKSTIIDKVNNTESSFDSSSKPSYKVEVPDVIRNNPVAIEEFLKKQIEIRDDIVKRVNIGVTDSIVTSIRVASFFVLIGAFLTLLIPNVHHKKEDNISAH